MKVCLKCFSVYGGGTPGNDVCFCSKCRRPLGKRCPKGHVNPFFSAAMTCLTCNEGPVDGVPYLSLSWIPPLLSVVLLIVAWRWAWDHPYKVAAVVWRAGVWSLGILFDTSPGRVGGTLRTAAVFYVALWLISFVLPQAGGRALRQFLKALPVRCWRGLKSLVRFLLPLVLRPLGRGNAKSGPGRQKDNGPGPD
jgi:hypothetical protein